MNGLIQNKGLFYAIVLAGLLSGCATHSQGERTPAADVKSGYIGDPAFTRDPNRKDWSKGYYVDAAGRFVPLDGQNPDSLGEGGGAPAIWYRVNKAD